MVLVVISPDSMSIDISSPYGSALVGKGGRDEGVVALSWLR